MTATTYTNPLARWFQAPLRVIRQISNHGLRYALDRAIGRWRSARRETLLGIQTTASIDGNELGNGDPDNLGYQPIPFESFDAALDHVDLSSGNEVFIDYGCGMGRAVVLAGTLSFRRVLGIELSADLAERARHNLWQAAPHLQCEAEIITADATKFELPADVTVVFMFNPFCGEILQDVLEQIHQSLQRAPRHCTFIYAHPRDNANALDDCQWLSRRIELETPNEPWQRLVIYDAGESQEISK